LTQKCNFVFRQQPPPPDNVQFLHAGASSAKARTQIYPSERRIRLRRKRNPKEMRF
jgi:hypothetical protein